MSMMDDLVAHWRVQRTYFAQALAAIEAGDITIRGEDESTATRRRLERIVTHLDELIRLNG